MAPQTPRMKKTATPSRMYSLTLIFSLTVVLARTPRLTAPQYSLYSFMVMERLSYREFSWLCRASISCSTDCWEKALFSLETSVESAASWNTLMIYWQ